MSLKCETCGKIYQWKQDLKRHQKTKHPSSTNVKECVHCGAIFKDQTKYFKHIRENHGHHDGIRDVHVPPMSDADFKSQKRDERKKNKEKLTEMKIEPTNHFDITTNESFKFKHPFCMMVAGPSRSGKTQWVVDLLREKENRIQPVPRKIVYCYAHWQPKYDSLKLFAPSTHFIKGLPYASFFRQLENCIIVLDDLMEVAMKDPNVMSIFTEGSHHRNVSVLFLSQNIFHQGKHSRTMSLNVQYMVLFKNARDKAQIQTLARQMFPTDWRSFLQHFESETSKEYGHVIIDLHPSTSDDQRIVSTSTQQRSPDIPSSSLSEQYYNMSNPNAQPLLDARKKLNNAINASDGTAEDKAQNHAAALDGYTLMRDKYKAGEGKTQAVFVKSKPMPQPNWETPVQAKTTKRKAATDNMLTPPATEMFTKKRLRAEGPPGIHLTAEELDPDDEDVQLMHYGKILPDGTDPKLLSFMDTDEERERKINFIKKHVMKEDELVDPEPRPGEDPNLLTFLDSPEQRAAKQRYVDHIQEDIKSYYLRRKMKP